MINASFFNSANQSNVGSIGCLFIHLIKIIYSHKEKLIDGVESLCGHFYCGIYYIGECLEENQCICGKKISLLFTEKMNKNIAWFNIDNASRSYTYIFYDSVYLMYKMIKDTKLYKWNLVWRSWGILLGIQYLSIEMYSLSVYWIIKVAIFCIIIEISIIFSSLAYFNAIITLSANFLSNCFYILNNFFSNFNTEQKYFQI